MIYIYDILLNLNEELYDFYDWLETDNYKHARKIPLFKINNYEKTIYNKIKVNNEFLNKIRNKTQVFKNKNLIFFPYLCLFTNGLDVIAIEFNKKGESIKKSKLLINEELEILEVCESLKSNHLDFEIVLNTKINKLTRKENEIINNIEKFINSSINNKNLINYLCYEWFEISNNNYSSIDLLNSIKSTFTQKHIQFLDFLNSIKINGKNWNSNK